jgi:hypothetical protein
MILSHLFQLVVLLFIAACCLLGYGYPGYTNRATGGSLFIIWFIIGIAAIVAIVIIMLGAGG